MAAIGLKSQIWNNNIRSIALLAFYPFLIAGLCWAMAFGFYYSFAPEMGTTFAFYSGDMQNVQAAANIRGDSATTFANNAILAHWPLILTVVLIWFTIAYFLQGTMIKKLSHAHSVTRAEEPELYNMLENLCITRGMTTPKLQIIETHARNAFASGITDSTYTVTVTRGLLQSLRKDEVEAVLAHELTHIENRDVRLLINRTRQLKNLHIYWYNWILVDLNMIITRSILNPLIGDFKRHRKVVDLSLGRHIESYRTQKNLAQ